MGMTKEDEADMKNFQLEMKKDELLREMDHPPFGDYEIKQIIREMKCPAHPDLPIVHISDGVFICRRADCDFNYDHKKTKSSISVIIDSPSGIKHSMTIVDESESVTAKFNYPPPVPLEESDQIIVPGLSKEEAEEIDRAMMNDPRYLKRKAEEEAKKEKARLDAIILNLTRLGKYVLNERPEGMSYEDFKYVRRELNRVRQGYVHGGNPFHKSTEKNSQTGAMVGVSYRKPDGTKVSDKKNNSKHIDMANDQNNQQGGKLQEELNRENQKEQAKKDETAESQKSDQANSGNQQQGQQQGTDYGRTGK